MTEIISVAAHSLGNACVGAALRQGMQDEQLCGHGSRSLAELLLYRNENPDDPMPIDDGLIKADLRKPTPQYARELGYQDYLTDIGDNAANPISYYNSLDFWLVTGQSSGELGRMPVDWITSQKKYKPDDRWGLGQYK